MDLRDRLDVTGDGAVGGDIEVVGGGIDEPSMGTLLSGAGCTGSVFLERLDFQGAVKLCGKSIDRVH